MITEGKASGKSASTQTCIAPPLAAANFHPSEHYISDLSSKTFYENTTATSLQDLLIHSAIQHDDLALDLLKQVKHKPTSQTFMTLLTEWNRYASQVPANQGILAEFREAFVRLLGYATIPPIATNLELMRVAISTNNPYVIQQLINHRYDMYKADIKGLYFPAYKTYFDNQFSLFEIFLKNDFDLNRAPNVIEYSKNFINSMRYKLENVQEPANLNFMTELFNSEYAKKFIDSLKADPRGEGTFLMVESVVKNEWFSRYNASQRFALTCQTAPLAVTILVFLLSLTMYKREDIFLACQMLLKEHQLIRTPKVLTRAQLKAQIKAQKAIKPKIKVVETKSENPIESKIREAQKQKKTLKSKLIKFVTTLKDELIVSTRNWFRKKEVPLVENNSLENIPVVEASTSNRKSSTNYKSFDNATLTSIRAHQARAYKYKYAPLHDNISIVSETHVDIEEDSPSTEAEDLEEKSNLQLAILLSNLPVQNASEKIVDVTPQEDKASVIEDFKNEASSKQPLEPNQKLENAEEVTKPIATTKTNDDAYLNFYPIYLLPSDTFPFQAVEVYLKLTANNESKARVCVLGSTVTHTLRQHIHFPNRRITHSKKADVDFVCDLSFDAIKQIFPYARKLDEEGRIIRFTYKKREIDIYRSPDFEEAPTFIEALDHDGMTRPSPAECFYAKLYGNQFYVIDVTRRGYSDLVENCLHTILEPMTAFSIQPFLMMRMIYTAYEKNYRIGSLELQAMDALKFKLMEVPGFKLNSFINKVLHAVSKYEIWRHYTMQKFTPYILLKLEGTIAKQIYELDASVKVNDEALKNEITNNQYLQQFSLFKTETINTSNVNLASVSLTPTR